MTASVSREDNFWSSTVTVEDTGGDTLVVHLVPGSRGDTHHVFNVNGKMVAVSHADMRVLLEEFGRAYQS